MADIAGKDNSTLCAKTKDVGDITMIGDITMQSSSDPSGELIVTWTIVSELVGARRGAVLFEGAFGVYVLRAWVSSRGKVVGKITRQEEVAHWKCNSITRLCPYCH